MDDRPVSDPMRWRQPSGRCLRRIQLLVAADYCITKDDRQPEKVLAWRQARGLVRGRAVDRFGRKAASPIGGSCIDGSLRKRERMLKMSRRRDPRKSRKQHFVFS